MSECAHHYDLEAPNGATSRGVCRLCGAVREFRNSGPDYDGIVLDQQNFKKKARNRGRPIRVAPTRPTTRVLPIEGARA